MNCRINRGRNWSSRILMEQYTTTARSWFVTLTYSDEEVPVTTDYVQTLRKREFQAWRKETNRHVGGFRYYAVGEYGDNTLRPHYHMAVFPRHDSQIKLITDAWDKGFISCYELTPERARYLANYTTKKLTNSKDSRLEPGQEPEFRLGSTRPGLGSAFIEPICARYRDRSGKALLEQRGDIERTIRIAGRIYPIAPFILEKCRRELGIPTRHEDRMTHEGYQYYHQLEEAECDPIEFDKQELRRYAEKTIRRTNWTTNV